MGRRGRRQVLQLDDVSSSHQSRRCAFQSQQVQDKSNQLVPNSLMNLVGAYNSDSDEDEEEQNEEEIHEVTEQKLPPLPPTLPAEPPAVESVEEKTPAVKADGSLDMEVASFLAEIESISTEQAFGNGQENDVTSTYLPKPDMGFMIKPDASAAAFSKPEEVPKKPKPASSNAYKSMFVKGEPEFVRPGDEVEKGGKQEEDEDELPEEPLSEWQIVQDDATQYYYYWNMVTNEVTWEIPPGYTQFLLRYKEYEERIAKIPKDKLQRLMEKAEKKMKDQAGKETQKLSASSSSQSNSTTKDSSTHSSSSHRSSKSSKHSKHSETNGSSDHVSSSKEKKRSRVEFGPSLPPPEFRGSEVESTVKTVNQNGTKDSVMDGGADLTIVPYELNAEETDTVSSTTVLPHQPEDEVGNCHASNHTASSATPLDMLSADDIINEVLMPAEEEIVQPNGDTEKSEEPTSVLVEKAEEPVEEDQEEEDDFDMDFDDIDDLDRALEKALEKKLEKKKAELLKLEEKSSALAAKESIATPSSPQPSNTQPAKLSHKEDQIKSEQAHSSSSTPSHEADQAKPTLSDQKTDEVLSPVPTATAEPETLEDPSVEVEESSESVLEVNTDKAEILVPPVLKRSAEGEVGKSDQEPDEKRARLVAYDVPESDEESMDVNADQVNMALPPDGLPEVPPDVDFSNILPTPPPEQVDNLAELQSMAETAQDKLAFLEVTTKGLTPLQITLIQLQTRLKDWQEGGLNAEYFFQRMSEVNGLLEHYETAAVPPGWACHWDRNFRRYFYTHVQTGESQWDYPDKNDDPASANREEPRSTKTRKKSKRRRSSKMKAKVTVGDSEDSMSKDGEVVSGSITTEDVDGAAMPEEDVAQFEQQQMVDNSDAELAEPDTTAPLTKESAQAAYQALFPGEPLPPGTELLFGLPPPPPPSFPPPDEKEEGDDYVCDDDDNSNEKREDGEVEKDATVDSVVAVEPVAPINEKSERFEPEDMEVSQSGDSWYGGSLETQEPPAEPGVIAKPPQLRFANLHPASAISSSSSSAWLPGVSGEGNRAVGADSAVLASQPVQTASTHLHPEVMAKVTASVSGPDVLSAPSSPKVEDGVRSAGSPAPVEAPAAGDHKHEKHKKKKKEKIGSSGLALKKKGVSSLVQKWQKVKREVEQEERANEQRQLAIRQQLEEWKKDNN